eukprot:CAMPEP_0202359002 /NCGR_PEP_ID=MMETSP1126-20121109/12453_1 /ASSEMBLY_ACC=CAM_ASM_000457 /TAXON_ID=3047 /ORGANISM="Dunaliella tertiolecta, Strain CCMP1320" /LENGTH=54 /DNA_ID=CAMNT_0048952295 /DNA_START=53 /DNA_END=213 /DNA_ORIENTATION=+
MRAGFPDTTSSADRNTKQPTLRATLTAYLALDSLSALVWPGSTWQLRTQPGLMA